MAQNSNDWMSISELAAKEHRTKQAIYNRVKKGRYETMTFRRGDKMIGILVREKN